ncbi:phosphoribosyltransferase-like protein [Jimgerdemannia flammicorona]|uniref:adenine phosphoribosyltransferase n=1 Tax=Jimgerdemannia flammicorona TaxID=994334 RepID=A0A433QXL9_9FUNG|nr:phosphoribosyltransferase-like protein [Jimgerdemannia flammicorona]
MADIERIKNLLGTHADFPKKVCTPPLSSSSPMRSSGCIGRRSCDERSSYHDTVVLYRASSSRTYSPSSRTRLPSRPSSPTLSTTSAPPTPRRSMSSSGMSEFVSVFDIRLESFRSSNRRAPPTSSCHESGWTSCSSPPQSTCTGLDARGFLFGPLIALRLGAAFVPVRKQGKLPGETVSTVYAKEYGEDIFELQKSAIKAGQRAIIVDDLIATGGSAKAAGELVRKAGGKTVEYLFVMELSFLNGAAKLDAPSYSLVKLDD